VSSQGRCQQPSERPALVHFVTATCRGGHDSICDGIPSGRVGSESDSRDLISVLFFGLGEQLWSPFLPAYLDAKTSSAGGHG